MKHFFFLFLAIPIVSSAQEPLANTDYDYAPLKNEIGINAFSINNLNWNNYYAKHKFEAAYNFATGIYFKHHVGKNALRFSADYLQNVISINMDHAASAFSYHSYGLSKTISFKTGMEKSFGIKRLQFSLFSDLLFNYNNYQGRESECGCFGCYNELPFYKETFEYGLDAGTGINYRITDKIKMALETSVQGFYSVYQNIYSPYSNAKLKEFGCRINPVSKLGVSFAF